MTELRGIERAHTDHEIVDLLRRVADDAERSESPVMAVMVVAVTSRDRYSIYKAGDGVGVLTLVGALEDLKHTLLTRNDESQR